ncbi:MAG: tRNA (adenosine(37)-N6)-dimethylallyltransferase MiaA [Gammaproteobacteria bacterium]|nr:tRNA (adenosine(37)-N6)-dimethylallyltransferase MiaA [Gammaproteobacteria bacterium]
MPDDRPSPLIALAGPTAVGKSALAFRLAEHFDRAGAGAEIVSVDSAQLYRGMDIGTAKPDAATRARVPHHLLDLLDPAESYSAARFAEDAAAAVAAIRSRGRVPILVGGTMLYFRALLHGLSPLPCADPVLRARLDTEAAARGWPALHARLAAADPVTAARLHPHDAQRIQRALEILELAGRPPSVLRTAAPPAARLGARLAFALPANDRAALHRRIAERFQRMLVAGLLDEVKRLRARGDLHLGLPALRAVGYRQLWLHLDGACDLDTAVARALAATRQYAKRQLTWLRAEPGFVALPDAEPEALRVVLRAWSAADSQLRA